MVPMNANLDIEEGEVLDFFGYCPPRNANEVKHPGPQKRKLLTNSEEDRQLNTIVISDAEDYQDN
jgi:hypothetical protein